MFPRNFLEYHTLKVSMRLVGTVLVGALAVAHAATGQMVQTHPSHVISYGMFNACTWSPDGSTLALAHSGVISLFDAETLQRLDTFFTTHTGSSRQLLNRADITSVAFSPDGQRIAVACSAVTVFSKTGKVVFTIETGGWQCVTFSHNGQYLTTGAGGGSVDLWNAATGEHAMTLAGHTGKVFCLAFSQDDRQLISGADDNTAILWDVAGGQAIRTFADHTDGVFFAGFMPDGTTPVTASYDDTLRRRDASGTVTLAIPNGTESLDVSAKFIAAYNATGAVTIWDTATNGYLGQFAPVTGDDYASSGTPRQVAFSPDGTRMVSGSARSKCVRLWDTTRWFKTTVFAGHAYALNAAAFSPDGKNVLTGSDDHTAKLWNAGAGGLVRTFTGHSNFVHAVAFSKDGTKALTGGQEGTAKVWNTSNGDNTYTFTGHGSSKVNSVAFSPDGTKALSGANDGTAKLWDISTGAVAQTYTTPEKYAVMGVAFSPDGNRVLLGMGNTAKTCNTNTGADLVTFGDTFSGPVSSVAFSPDGTKVIVGYRYGSAQAPGRMAKVWDAANGTLLQTFKGHTQDVNAVAFSPDGKQALTGGQDSIAFLWDVQTGQALAKLSGHANSVNAVAFSPDGEQAVTASTDKTARVTFLDATIPVASLNLGLRSGWPPLSVVSALSPDGAKVASSSDDNTALLWDAASRSILQTFTGHTRFVTGIAFSPDGTKLITGSPDKTAIIWDAATGKALQKLTSHTDEIGAVSFSHDGTKALTASRDGTARVWNVEDGSEARILFRPGSINHFYSAAFSPDDRRILTGVDGNNAILWDAATGSEIISVRGTEAVAFSPDGTRLLATQSGVGNLSRSAAIWDATTGAQLCTFINIPGVPPPASDSMSCAAFSRDGAKVITGSAGDATARVWDAATGREVTRFLGCGASTISTSPDGVHFLTGDPDFGGMVVAWEMDPAAQPSAEPFTANTPVSSSMAANALRDYSLEVAPGATSNYVVRFRHDKTDSGTWRLLGAQDRLPNLQNYDWSGLFTESGNGWERLEMPLPASSPGKYNFSAYYSTPLGHDPVPFTMECVPVQMYVIGLNATSASNTGTASVRLFGLGFQDGLTVQLLDRNNNVARTFAPIAWNAVSLTLAMDLTGLAAGDYHVAVVWPGRTLTLKQPFTVQQGAIGPRLEAHIEVPPITRYDRPSTLWLDYANTGDEDMPAPLLVVSIEGQPAVMRLLPTLQWSPPIAQVVGVNSQGEAGILPAGAHHRIPIYFTSYGEDHSTSGLTLTQFVGDETPIEWEKIGIDMRPPGFSDEAWEAVWAKFSAKAGVTWASLLNLIAQDATWLAQHGRPTNDLTEILRYELSDADARRGGSAILCLASDATCPARNLPISFSRAGSIAVDQRLRVGPLGRAWSHSFEYKIEFPSQYRAALVEPSGTVRRFEQRRYAGVWESDLGDNGQFEGSQGNPCKLTEENGTWAAFDAQGNLTEICESNGDRITLIYDGNQNLTRITHSNGGALTLGYNGQGRIQTLTDQAGQTTTYAYDDAGEHLVSVTAPGGVTSSYGYETSAGPALHALTSITYPDGSHRTFTYDADGRLSALSRGGNAERMDVYYDGLAGKTITDACGDSWQYFYGPAGELLQFADPFENVSLLTYDGGYNLTRLTLPDGAAHELRYNERNKLVEWLNPNLDSTKWGYTRVLISPGLFPDRMASIVDPNGNESTFTYNPLANLTTIAYPGGVASEYTYNDNGSKLESFSNRRQQKTTCTFNARGQLTGKSCSDGSSASYAYDAAGRLISATNAVGTITMTYDARGYMATIQYPSGHGYTFQYNNAGLRTQRVADDGYTLNYAYDAAGHLASLSDGSGTQFVQYAYDATGRLAREIRANGTYTTYSYDAAGRLESIVHYAPDGAVQSYFDYAYDANGNPISVATSSGTNSYRYDFAGQLISADLSGGRFLDYQYDAAGNRILAADNGFQTFYKTNELNQYMQAGSASFLYDADGNLVSKQDATGGTTFQYDAENRLARVVTPANGAWDYTYDALGNRTGVTHGGQTTHYVHDPYGISNVAAEYDNSGNLTARYAYAVGLVARQAANGQYAYYAFDAAGNTRQVSNTVGVVVNEYDYDPFGGILEKTESWPNPYRFVGRFGVAEDPGGQLFMKLRYYEAASGRFLSPDPLGYAPGANLYSYAQNSPIRYVDPEGQAPRLSFPPHWQNPDPNNESKNTPPPPKPPTPQQGQETPKPSTQQQGQETPKPARYDLAEQTVQQLQGGPAWEIARWLNWLECRFPTSSGSVVWQCNPAFETVSSHDPNEKVSPRGAGLESERIVPLDQPIPYTIFFENKSSASAPAQTVRVTDTLDANLDIATFALTGIAWGGHQVNIPSGKVPFHARESVSDYRDNVSKTWWIDVDVTLNGSGDLQCTLTTLDPDTGLLPEGPLAGFLPPNDETHRGEGSVMFSVKPKADAALGTKITNKASIVFDTNAAIETNEVFNTIGVIYKLKLSADETKGTLTAAESAPYAAGTVVHLTATPLAGFRVLQWSGTDSDALADATNTVTMTGDKTVSVSFAEIAGEGEGEGEAEHVGSLSVDIEPEYARNSGGQWRVDGGDWQDSGVTLAGLAAGSHLVEFKDISNAQPSGCSCSQALSWTNPASLTVTVTSGQTTAITGTYVLSQKTLAASVLGKGSKGDLLFIGSVLIMLLVSHRKKYQART